MQKFAIPILSVVIIILLGIATTTLLSNRNTSNTDPSSSTPRPQTPTQPAENEGGLLSDLQHPLSIAALRAGEYPGSNLVIEQTLSPGSNYQRYIVSYRSEGLKIYALLTVPNAAPPSGGYPAVVFNHGYIPPREYRTTERYVAYTDAFSRNGYVLLRPDYRGHGNSEGEATGGYGSNAYTIDVLNAYNSLKRELAINDQSVDINPEKIGMWGHSMGGFITLRSMVVDPTIKAGVIWAGVVAPYDDLVNSWRRRNPTNSPNPSNWRQRLENEYGYLFNNTEFWNTLSANAYLSDISGPLQIHHGTADDSVPVEFSQKLQTQMEEAGKPSTYYEYPGDDHNLSKSFSTAINRSVQFFNEHLK